MICLGVHAGPERHNIPMRARKGGPTADTPLESVEGWTAEKVSKMKDVWITTAEQVVALGATTNGVRSLSEQLDVDLDEAQRLLAAARAHLSPAAQRELDQPADTSDFGLGVLPPEMDNSDGR
jgi:hypothetical protein